MQLEEFSGLTGKAWGHEPRGVGRIWKAGKEVTPWGPLERAPVLPPTGFQARDQDSLPLCGVISHGVGNPWSSTDGQGRPRNPVSSL